MFKILARFMQYDQKLKLILASNSPIKAVRAMFTIICFISARSKAHRQCESFKTYKTTKIGDTSKLLRSNIQKILQSKFSQDLAAFIFTSKLRNHCHYTRRTQRNFNSKYEPVILKFKSRYEKKHGWYIKSLH